MKTFLISLFLGLFAASACAESSYASIDGLKMYYQVHGEGRPTVLLHEDKK